MSTFYINYFNFDAPNPIPREPERVTIPPEIILHITPFVTSNSKNIISWAAVCRFTLAACIESCVRFRNFLLFSQLPAFSYRQKDAKKSAALYRSNQCIRSDAEGVSYYRSTGYFKHLSYFNLNAENPVAHHIDMLDTEILSKEYNVRSSDIKEALFLREKLIIVTGNLALSNPEGNLFFFEIGAASRPNLMRHVVYKGDVGFLNNKAYVIDYETGECHSLDLEEPDSQFELCDFEFNFTENSKLITSSDYLYHLTEIGLEKLEMSESGGLVVSGDTIDLPSPLPLCFPVKHSYFIYKNWFVYPATSTSLGSCIIDLSNGKSYNVEYPIQPPYLIFIKDDFLFLNNDKGENVCIHIPTKRDFSQEFNQLISPILKGENGRLIDLSLLQNEDKKLMLRLLLAGLEQDDKMMRKTWTIDLELNQKTAVPTRYKTYLVAAGVFLALGIALGALFYHFHLAPYIKISQSTLLSLPAALSLSLGFGLAITSLIIASVKRKSYHL